MWANPEMFQRNDLQPRLFFDPSADQGKAFAALSGYLSKALARYEQDPENRNLFSMKRRAGDALREIEEGQNIPGRVIEKCILSGSAEEGEVVIDMGPCRIRYYNHRIPGANDPGSSYDVLENKKVGEYLSRQILARRPSSAGSIARGDANELYKAFAGRATPSRKIRGSLNRKISRALANIRKRADKNKLSINVSQRINTAIKRVESMEFVEFDAIVIPEKKDASQARGWLLGFNTARFPVSFKESTTYQVNALLREKFPNTVGLASQVLDVAENDELTLEEYLFHEIVCPYFGHEKGRGIQEDLYRENYEGISGDTTKRHADGELALVLKKVIWDACKTPKFEKVSREKIDKEKPAFEKQDFTTSDGPQKATKFYTLFKKYYERVVRSEFLRQSRRENARPRNNARKLLKKLQGEYEKVVIRLRWIWEMESIWAKARESRSALENRKLTDPEKQDKREEIKNIAQEIIDKHRDFVKNIPEAAFLDEDAHVTGVLNRMYKVVEEGLEEKEVIKSPMIDFAKRQFDRIRGKKKGEAAKPDDAEKAADRKDAVKKETSAPGKVKRSVSFRDIFRAISIKALFVTFVTAAMLSFLLYIQLPVTPVTLGAAALIPLTTLVYMLARRWGWKGITSGFVASVGVASLLFLSLPVNTITVGLAVFLPIALFVYLLIRNWSWKNLVVSLAVSALLVFLTMHLAIPWFGLSLSIIIMARMAARRGQGGVSSGPVGRYRVPRGTVAKGTKPPAAKERTTAPAADKDKTKKPDEPKIVVPREKTKWGTRAEMEDPDIAEDRWGWRVGGHDFKKLKISPDILSAQLQIMQYYDKEAEAETWGQEREGEKIEFYHTPRDEFDTRQWLYRSFILNAEERKSANLRKQDLDEYRPLVEKKIAELRMGVSYGWELAVLHAWETHSYEQLAKALEEIAQEVSQELGSCPGEEVKIQSLAIRCLIAEYFKMPVDGQKFHMVGMYIRLLKARERATEGDFMGEVHGKDFYDRARQEFYWKNYAESEKAFAKAIETEKNKGGEYTAQFMLDAATVKYYLAAWDPAKWDESNRLLSNSLAYWLGQKKTEVKKYREELTKLFIRKTKKRIKMDGFKQKPGDLPLSPAGFRFIQRFVAPFRPFWAYAAIDAPEIEEKIFTLAPFALFATLLATGVIGLSAFLGSMAAVYGLFVILHAGNIRRAPPEITGLRGKLRYAFKAPLTIAGFNMMTSAVSGFGLNYMVQGRMPASVITTFTVIFIAIAYNFAKTFHKQVNERSVKDKDHSPAGLRFLHKLVAPFRPFHAYAALDAPEIEERIFTLLPFGTLAVLMAAGVVGIYAFLGGMAGVYSLFMILHAGNIRRAPDEAAGLRDRLRYAFKAPLSVAGFNMLTSTVFGLGLNYMIEVRMPGSVVTFFTVLFTWIAYEFARMSHENANKKAAQDKDHSPAALVGRDAVKDDASADMAREMKAKIRRGEKVNLLFSCILNAQRSMLLDVISKDVAQRGGFGNVSVDSCGIQAVAIPYGDLVEVCIEKGIDLDIITEFSTAQMSSEILYEADYVIIADGFVEEHIRRKFPEYLSKVIFLSDVSPSLRNELVAHLSEREREVSRYVPDYSHVEDKVSGGEYFDLFYAAVKRDLFGMEEEGEEMPLAGQRKGLFEVSEESGLPVGAFTLPNTTAVYPGAGHDAWAVAAALEAFAELDTFVLVDNQYDKLRLSSGKFYTRMLLVNNLDSYGITLDAVNTEKALRGEFDENGLLEFEAVIDTGGTGEQRKVRFILDARDYFIPRQPGYGFAGGFGLTVIKYPGWGGAMGDADSNPGVVAYSWDRFFEKVTKETARGGLILVKNALLPSEKFIEAHGLETVHATELRDPDRTGEKEHVIYRKNRRADAVEEKPVGDSAEEKRNPVPGRDNIIETASSAIPRFVNALIAASRRDEKVVLALDQELGEGEINGLLRKLIGLLPAIEGNNEDLRRFFRNLEIIKGEGASLARRVSNITTPGRGGAAPENVIIITRNSNVTYYSALEGRATIAGVEDTAFSGNAYLPLLEIMLFSIGRHLGWDEKTLREHYAMIPNALSIADLTPDDLALLFGRERSIMVIKLIPDAVEFDRRELRDLMDNIRIMLARA